MWSNVGFLPSALFVSINMTILRLPNFGINVQFSSKVWAIGINQVLNLIVQGETKSCKLECIEDAIIVIESKS
jgi:hypothetical protein